MVNSNAVVPAMPKAEKPFTVRCKFNKEVEYTFKNLPRTANDEILQTASLSLEQMLALYQQAEINIATTDDYCRRENIAPDGRAVMAVPTTAMTLDEEWCRNKRCDYPHVAEMVCFPVRKARRMPLITIRKVVNAQGVVTAVFARVADGAHRVLASIENGEAAVLCEVTIVEVVEEEATIYSTCNYRTRPHAQLDIYKARKASNDPKIDEILESVRAVGLEMSTDSRGRAAYPNIKVPYALEEIYDKYGKGVLERVLFLVSQTSAHWRCAESLGGDMLRGLAMFIDKFEAAGFVNSTVVEQMFNDCTPNILLNTKNTAQTVEKMLHVTVTSDVSQYFRHLSLCTTFLTTYINRVKTMTRDKAAGGTQLKAMLEIWHEKKMPSFKRDRVEFYHNKLADLAPDLAHIWVIPESTSGFFPSHITDNARSLRTR
jgi:hypothetical protein